jgi:hypothetical protein
MLQDELSRLQEEHPNLNEHPEVKEENSGS